MKKRQTKQTPSLYGITHSNRDFSDPYYWGKNQFNMTIREYLGDEIDIDFYYRHPRSYARRGVFSVDEPSPTIRGVNRPIPDGYPGHEGDAAPINAHGLRPLTTRERSRIQTFPAEWDLIGNKSDLEQIIGNAVPCALGEFIGEAINQFEMQPRQFVGHQDLNTVTVFIQRVGEDFEEKVVDLRDTRVGR